MKKFKDRPDIQYVITDLSRRNISNEETAGLLFDQTFPKLNNIEVLRMVKYIKAERRKYAWIKEAKREIWIHGKV